MDNELLYSLAYTLKEELEKDPLILSLNILEKKLEKNNEAIKLSYQKDMALLNYNDLLKIYKENSNEIIPALKKLSTAKEELYNYPLVKEYLKKYSEVKALLNEINRVLFKDFEMDGCKYGN